MTPSPLGFQLVPTKLHRPRVDRRWVVRPRLLTALEDARSTKVTLISAPAGYGKTTLAAQWLSHVDIASAWLDLDQHDRDPERFLRYLIAAIRQVSPGFGSELESLCSAAVLPPPDYLADSLVTAIAALPHPLVVVLDDFHLCASEPLLTLLARFVEYQPDHIHLVILTRVDPSLPLSTWRVRGWIREIRAAELQFFRDEAQAFFALAAGPELPPDALDVCFERTEGWVAGMQLARLSFATGVQHRPPSARDWSGGERMIADFLLDEVVSHQTPEIRDFLAVTALFDRFCAPLCDAVLSTTSSGSGSQALIGRLEHENLFLVPLDTERRWYRYHHLFRALLTERIGPEVSKARRTELLQRAGAWFAESGLIEEALHYFVAADDMAGAARLVERHLGDMLETGSSRRVLWQWLELFPETAVERHPAIALAMAHRQTFHWDGRGAMRLLDVAEAALNDPTCGIPEPRRRDLLADIDTQRGFHLYWRRDSTGALAHVLRALDNLTERRPYHHFLAVQYAALSYAMTGARDKALQLLHEAISTASASGNHFLVGLLFVQAALYLYAGELNAAEEVAVKGRALADDHPVREYWRPPIDWLLGCVAYERNRLETAAWHFERVEAQRYQVTTRLYHDSLLGLALVATARGNLARAQTLADDARTFAAECHDPFSLAISDSFERRLAVAGVTARPAVPPSAPPIDSHLGFCETPSLTYVEYQLDSEDPGDRQAALAYAEGAVALLRAQHNPRQLIQTLAVHAVALQEAGRQEEALAVVDEAMRRAEPLGFVRTFADRGQRMAQLLRAYASEGPAAAYAQRVLEACSESAGSATPRHTAGTDTTATRPAVTLSRREREVLSMLDTTLANKEIADHLSISAETVKRHIYNIYRKLDVRTRLQAIDEARKLGLLAGQ